MRKLLPLLIFFAACASDRPPGAYLEAPQGRIHVDDGGKGSAIPIVFIHGNGANSTQWQAQLLHFRKTRRAIAMDLRGMGLSDAPANGDYSINSIAEDIHDVVNALNIDRFVIVGHSFGGAVVASYAARHPERVAAVVYADSTGDVTISRDQADKFLTSLRMDKKHVVAQWFAPILKNARPEVKEAVLLSVDLTSAEAFAGALEQMLFFKVVQSVEAYPGPKFAIATEGNTNPSSLHVQIPSMPVKKMGGTSHWLMMDRPEEFNRLLEEFLAQVK